MASNESQKGQNEQSTFTKRAGTTDLGKDYENYVVARFILKLLKNNEIKSFQLSSNDENFGAFDDVVIQIEKSNQNILKYAIQLKHVTADKNLKLQKLEKEKDDFSIRKYLKSFQAFEERLQDHKCILWTNLKFAIRPNTRITLGGEETLEVEISECEADPFLRTSERTVCHRFTVVGTEPKCVTFFNNFFLYSSQVNVDQLKFNLPEYISQIFSCDRSVFHKYINFISEWNIRKGRKEKLDMQTMQQVITLYLLDSAIQPISFGHVNTNAKLLQKAVSKFHVTIFNKELLPKINKMWGDSRNELCNISEINRIRKQYQISPKHITVIEDLTDEECIRLLWILGKCPLVVTHSDNVSEAIKLCGHVVLMTDCILEHSSVFQRLSNLRLHGDIFKDVTTNFLCTFLSTEMTLQDLIKEDKEFEEIITPSLLLEMVDQPLVVRQEREQLPVPYIPRLLSKTVIDFKCLELVGDNTFIIISNVSEQEEEEIKKRGVLVPNFHMIREELTSQKFKEICMKHRTKKNIHHLRLEEGNLEWVRSSSTTSDLEEYHRGDHFLEEDTLISAHSHLNLVTDDPGMGKTIFLKSLKNTLSSKYWTTILTPKDISDFCHQDKTFDDFILDKCTTKFERHIVKLLMHKGQVAYLWDAIDEISEAERATIEDLILEMADRVAVQWITSRRHLKKILENKFRVLSRSIRPFDDQQQIRYIHERLESICTGDELEKITDAIRSTIVLTLLEIPLQIHMVTELFRKDSKKYEALFQKMFSVNDLYHHFVEQKFDLYFKEKSNFPSGMHSQVLVLDYLKTSRIRSYEEVALKTLFEEGFLEQLNLKCVDFLEEVKNKGDWLGFVTETERPQFAHISYAEYFAAAYFARNAKNIINMEIIFDRKYTNVRYFFDMFLAKDSPAHIAALCGNLNYLQKCDFGCRDLFGRNLLHLVSSWGERYPILEVVPLLDMYLINDKTNYTVKIESEEHKQMLDYLLSECDPHQEDDLFHFDSLMYAEKCDCLLSVAAIEQKQRSNYLESKDYSFICSLFYYSVKFGDLAIFSLFDDIKYIFNIYGRSLLHLAAENNSYKHMEFLLCHQKYRDNINSTNLGGGTPLHIAANYGTDLCASLLLEFEANVNAVDKDKRTPLYLACLYGHEAVVDLLIRNGADANLASKDNWTPLHPASGEGYVEIVDKLIKYGADIDEAIDEGWTSLHLATFYRHQDIVKRLIEAGANVNICDKQGWTALHVVAKYGNDRITSILLESGADPNIGDSIKWTPLHLSSKYGKGSIVKLLIEAGANIEAVNKDGSTPVYIASQNGSKDIVELLIGSGADITTSRSKGWTPLHIACQNCHDNVALVLIKSGASVNVTNQYGWTPLHITAIQGFDTTSDLLIKAGTIIDARDSTGIRALQAASAGGHHKVVKLLVDAGSEVDVRDKDGTTPLIEASCRGYYEVVELLVKSGADVNTIDNNEMTPLGSAYHNKHERVVQLLIDSGADMVTIDRCVSPLYVYCKMGAAGEVHSFLEMGASTETVGPNGWRPIHVACSEGHVEIVKLLLQAGADFNAVTGGGETPLEIATSCGHNSVADLLKMWLYRVNIMLACYRCLTSVCTK